MAKARWALSLLLSLWVATAGAVSAEAFIVTTMDGSVLLEKNADQARSIASITKLFVAERSSGLDPEELIQITKEDIRHGQMRSTPLKAGQSYSRRHLTELALVSSDNVAAIALGRQLPSIATDKAELVEASGLDPANQSSARHIAAAARELYTGMVGAVSVMPKATVGDRRSTNPLLDRQGWVFYLSKTGFIRQAGGCLVVVMEVKKQLVTVVILGSTSTKQRWNDLIDIRRQLGDDGFYVPIQVTKVRKKRR